MNEEIVYLDERGVFVSNHKVIMGSQSFMSRNIGAISLMSQPKNIWGPIIGLIIFSLPALIFFLVSIALFFNGESPAATLLMFGIFGGGCAIFIMALRRPRKYYIQITASGGAINAMETTDSAFLSQVIHAVHQATA